MAESRVRKVRKAKAKLSLDNLLNLLNGEKVMVSLKDGENELKLELTVEKNPYSFIGDLAKSLDEQAQDLSKGLDSIFKNFKTSMAKIFRRK